MIRKVIAIPRTLCTSEGIEPYILHVTLPPLEWCGSYPFSADARAVRRANLVMARTLPTLAYETGSPLPHGLVMARTLPTLAYETGSPLPHGLVPKTERIILSPARLMHRGRRRVLSLHACMAPAHESGLRGYYLDCWVVG